MSILFIIIGAVIVLWGADRLTDGATAVALKWNIPQIVIGLTVVALGTSMPEFFVSLMSALKGTSGLAVGNIVGSNIFNTLCIVGVSALVAPIAVRASTVKKDMPIAVLAAAALTAFCCFDRSVAEISRFDAGILFVAFIAFMVYTVHLVRKGEVEAVDTNFKPMGMAKAIAMILLGLVCLVAGSELFVDGAKSIAKSLGVSDAVIGLTIVACGTSLPELATSVVAARKGRSAIAIGNVIGSNVFNILMIVGLTGLVRPMPILDIGVVDFSVLTGSILLLWLFTFTKLKVERWEGAVLTAIFVGYMSYVVYSA